MLEENKKKRKKRKERVEVLATWQLLAAKQPAAACQAANRSCWLLAQGQAAAAALGWLLPAASQGCWQQPSKFSQKKEEKKSKGRKKERKKRKNGKLKEWKEIEMEKFLRK